MSILQKNPKKQLHLLNDHQVADTLGLSVTTVRRWRLHGRGPKFMKIGGSVRYDEQALQQWLATRPVGGEDAGGRSE